MRTARMFWGMLTVVGMLFASSCSQNELFDNSSDSGNYVSAKFTLNSPESGITSRAVGDGTKVNKVVCATFDQYGTELTELRQCRDIKDQTAVYSIRLVKGQAYRVAFFAYYAPEGTDAPKYYDITDLKNIVIINQETKKETSNLEDRDAFTAKVEIAAEKTMKPINENVDLFRPFAQLNLGSEFDDWNAAIAAGVEVDETEVVVSDVYTAFSAYDDKVVGETSEVTFTLNAIPEDNLQIDTNKDEVNDKNYKYLALNYILVGDKTNEKSLTNVKFIWKDTDNDKTNNPVTEFKNIPVQRNYRTNIIGFLLTNPAVFNVTIDERFEKPDNNVDGEEYEKDYDNVGGDDNTTEGDDDNNIEGGDNEGEGTDEGEGNVIPDVVNFSEIKEKLEKVSVTVNNRAVECYLIEDCTYKTLVIDENEAILLNNVDVATLQYDVTLGFGENRSGIYLKDVDFSNNPTGFNQGYNNNQFVYIENCEVNNQLINNSNKNTVFSLSNGGFNNQSGRVGFSDINVQ